jgi:hypothetical protein
MFCCLNFLVSVFFPHQAGSEKLEAAGVNVWKLPLHQYIPEDFFGRETKAMRQEDGSKLASVGVAGMSLI